MHHQRNLKPEGQLFKKELVALLTQACKHLLNERRQAQKDEVTPDLNVTPSYQDKASHKAQSLRNP